MTCRLFLIRCEISLVRAQRVALALLAVGDVLEHQQHAVGVVARLRDLAGIQVEDAAAEARKIVLDLEALDRLVFRQHLFHQMAQRRHVPLVLAAVRKRAAHASRPR